MAEPPSEVPLKSAMYWGPEGRIPQYPDKPSFSKPNAPLVTILVGAESASFIVHREVISYHSPVFKAAFESIMIEGQTQCMKLEDVESEVFGLLVHWLYTTEIEGEDSMMMALQHQDPNMPGDAAVKFSMLLAKLWVLAERFIVSSLPSQINSLLTSMSGLMIGISLPTDLKCLVLFVYTAIAGSAELKDFAIHLMIDKMDLGDEVAFKACIDDLPPEVLADLTVAMARGWHADKMQLQYGSHGGWRKW